MHHDLKTTDADSALDIPEFLRRQHDEPKRSPGKRLQWTRDMRFPEDSGRDKEAKDPGTIKLLAEIAAREKAEADRKAIAKEDARIIREKQRTHERAMQAAVAQLHLLNPSTAGETIMATKKKPTTKRKSGKVVTTRFKSKAPKKAEPLKKAIPRKAVKVDGPIKVSKKVAASLVEKDHPASIKPPGPKPESKGAKLEAILRAGKVSAADIAEQLGWLKHTTRAAITRVGFEVTTEKQDGVTLYHIAKDAAAKVKAA